MNHTTSIIETGISLITSLLKVFVMFHMRLFHDKYNEEENFVEDIAIKCSNYRRITGLCLKDKTVQSMIAKFVLNTLLHHVGLSWMISSNK